MKFCKKCGSALVENNKFCIKCGAKINAVPDGVLMPDNVSMPPAAKKRRTGLIAIIALIAAVAVFVLGAGGTAAYVIINGADSLPLIGQYFSDTASSVSERSSWDDDWFAAEPSATPPPSTPTPPHIIATEDEEFISAYTSLFLSYSERTIYMANLMGIELGADMDEYELSLFIYDNRDSNYVFNKDALPHAAWDILDNDPSFPELSNAAEDFLLWDMDEDGAPLIGISFYPMFANGKNPYYIYKFVNGGYTRLGPLYFYHEAADFYKDSDGRLFIVSSSYFGELPYIVYLNITDTGIYTDVIDYAEWAGTWNEDVAWELLNEMNYDTHLLPGMPFSGLTVIASMADRKDDITKSLQPVIRARYDDSYTILNEIKVKKAEARAAIHPARLAIAEYLEAIPADERDEHFGPGGWSFSSGELWLGIYYNDDFGLLATGNPLTSSATVFTDDGSGDFIKFDNISIAAYGYRGWGSILVQENGQGVFTYHSDADGEAEAYYKLLVNNYMTEIFSGHASKYYSAYYYIGGDAVSASAYETERALISNQPFLNPMYFENIDAAIAALLDPTMKFNYVPAVPSFIDTSSGGFIINESSLRRLEAWELTNLTKEQLRIARNEIYARNGYIFTVEDMITYFNDMSWYHGYIASADFNESMLSEIERDNVALISAEEAKRP